MLWYIFFLKCLIPGIQKKLEYKLVLEPEFVLPEWKLVPLGISHRTLIDLARAVGIMYPSSWNNKVLSNGGGALGNHPEGFNFFKWKFPYFIVLINVEQEKLSGRVKA